MVVQLELVAFQRAAQRVFDLQGPGGTRVQIGCEKAKAVAPALLGAVHGGIGTLVQGVERVSVRRIHGNAHGQGGGEFVRLDLKRLGHRDQQALGYVSRLHRGGGG